MNYSAGLAALGYLGLVLLTLFAVCANILLCAGEMDSPVEFTMWILSTGLAAFFLGAVFL